jgi:hypothetical protein
VLLSLGLFQVWLNCLALWKMLKFSMLQFEHNLILGLTCLELLKLWRVHISLMSLACYRHNWISGVRLARTNAQANYSQSWPWVLYEPACYMNSLSALSQPAFKPQLSHFLLCSIKTFLLVRMTVIITWLPNPVLLLKVANKDWMSSWNIHFQW